MGLVLVAYHHELLYKIESIWYKSIAADKDSLSDLLSSHVDCGIY